MAATQQTICWECSHATGGCSWADDGIPVKGWEAIETKKKSTLITYKSYLVMRCPMFDRDAYANGLKRYRKDDPNCIINVLNGN